MKIIAVNINKALASGASELVATERAWKLNLNNCSGFDYVIGISGGVIRGWYNLNGVHVDYLEPPRLKFDLTDCDPSDAKKIDNYINKMGIQLSKIRTKYIR
jgi:hypothetical protein